MSSRALASKITGTLIPTAADSEGRLKWLWLSGCPLFTGETCIVLLAPALAPLWPLQTVGSVYYALVLSFSQSQILKKHFFKITFKYKSIIFTENSSANVHLKRWYLSTSPGNRSFVHFMWAEYNPPVEV